MRISDWSSDVCSSDLGTLCVLYDTETGTQGTGGADTGTEDDRATACGKGTVAGLVATAIGTNAEASGGRAVALGYDSHATSSDTIAIGVNSHASGSWSPALGGGSQGTAFGANPLGVSTHTRSDERLVGEGGVSK